MSTKNNYPNFANLSKLRPQAWANIYGSRRHPNLVGNAWFYQTVSGVVVAVEASGLPASTQTCADHIFGLHIHEGSDCTGNDSDPFADVGSHYNPHDCPHPYHAGDLPPLFGCDGKALSIFLTNRFDVKDIVGKTIIIHDSPDDFTTQPSGNSGTKIACGKIEN